MDGLLEARARASQAMDGFLEHTNIAANSQVATASNVLVGVVILLSFWRSMLPSIVDEAFALVPHHTVFSPIAASPLPFLWNVATAQFFEGNLLKAIIVAPWCFSLANMLERL